MPGSLVTTSGCDARQYAWNASTLMPALRLKNDSALTMIRAGRASVRFAAERPLLESAHRRLLHEWVRIRGRDFERAARVLAPKGRQRPHGRAANAGIRIARGPLRDDRDRGLVSHLTERDERLSAHRGILVGGTRSERADGFRLPEAAQGFGGTATDGGVGISREKISQCCERSRFTRVSFAR